MEQEEKSRRKLEKKQQLEELRMKAEMDENLYEERIHELDEDSYIGTVPTFKFFDCIFINFLFRLFQKILL